jgi:hypothetical protein
MISEKGRTRLDSPSVWRNIRSTPVLKRVRYRELYARRILPLLEPIIIATYDF